MKKILLGSTALIAAGFAASQASAEERIKLELGGYFDVAFGGAAGQSAREEWDSLGGTNNVRNYAFYRDSEVYFLGKTTLDNGITVGVRAELELQSQNSSQRDGSFDAGDQIDAAYAYLQGGFGELAFGDRTGVVGLNCIVAPTAGSLIGSDSARYDFTVSPYRNATCAGVADKATKIQYFTPNFYGFQFGVDWAPDGSEDNRGSLRRDDGGNSTSLSLSDDDGDGIPDSISEDTSGNGGDVSQIVNLGATYNQEFGGVAVALAGGAEFGFDRETDAESDENATTAWYNIGGTVSYAGFTFGSAFGYYDDTQTDEEERSNDAWAWSAGVTYNWDAYTVGIDGSYGQYNVQDGGDDFDDDVSDQGQVDGWEVHGTASYALGPGIDLDAGIGYVTYDGEQDSELDYDAVELATGIRIGF